jgi:N-acyl-D-aspartate/D-glutamate deacylase
MPPTCDNGVAANAWMDQNMMGVKWNYPISSYGVMTASDGVAFQNISGLLVHIALSTRALSESRREVENAGEAYYTAIRNILERSGTIEQRFESTVELSMSIRN